MFNAAFQPARTDYDWLSRDPAQVDAYVADPLCGFGLEPAGVASLKAAAPRTGDGEAIATIRPGFPLYVLSGTADPICPARGFRTTHPASPAPTASRCPSTSSA